MAKKQKDAVIYVRMTKREHARVGAAARREGLPIATYARKQLVGRANGLSGVHAEGPGDRALLTAGLRVDRPRASSLIRRRGTVIKPERATGEIMRLRAEQVGPKGASATVTRCDGMWLGGAEPTLHCEIEFMPTPQEQKVATFRENMLDLAEKVAERFGQEEVWLRMSDTLYRATAPGEPAPKGLRPGGKVVRGGKK